MIIGKWNPSVILTYMAVILSILGISFSLQGQSSSAMLCLIWVGIIDLLDGPVARKMKRTEDEKVFGIMLDTTADVINFLVFPIVIALASETHQTWMLIVYGVYAVLGIARLSAFTSEEMSVRVHSPSPLREDKPVQFYTGLPVTYVALILPFVNLLRFILDAQIFHYVFLFTLVIIALLFVIPIKVHKPGKIGIIAFALLAIVMTLVYIFLF